MQHFKDRSAFETITTEQELWAKSILFDEFISSWANSTTSDYAHYLLDNQKKLGDKLAAINFLRLQDKKDLKIIDIGAGCGHFVKLANLLGHNAIGTEINSSLTDLKLVHNHYDVNVIELEIKRQEEFKLPDTYDLITALRIVFDTQWTNKDWLFFKENCFEYLNSNGTLFLKTNIKHQISESQAHVEQAFGESLTGWNSLTFCFTKQ